jgi:methylated-DNA-[protein]-cysteine S-methyltransferase
MTATALSGRRAHAVVDSPVGPITLLATDGRLTGLYLSEGRHPPAPEQFGAPQFGAPQFGAPQFGAPQFGAPQFGAPQSRAPDAAPFAAAATQLGEYFAGRLTSFDLPVTMMGTAFQRLVWSALPDIPYGTTVSYRELAALIGRPSAARAVGLANGRNPVSIIVPCHRVIGSDGSLTGYGGGLERKRYLLDLERRAAAGGGPATG